MSEIQEGVRKALLAGVGAVAMTAEKSRELVDQLVKKGEEVAGQGKVLNEELKQKLADQAEKLAGQLRQEPECEVDRIVRDVRSLTPEQRTELMERLSKDVADEGE